MAQQWNWTFHGYQTPAGRRVIQEWLDGLPEDAKDEAIDTLTYYQHQPPPWKRPHFDPMSGEPVSEIIFWTKTHTYRCYGFYGPAEIRQAYTILFAHDKKVKNDKKGKREAADRRKQVERRECAVHKLKLADDPSEAPPPRKSGAGQICRVTPFKGSRRTD